MESKESGSAIRLAITLAMFVTCQCFHLVALAQTIEHGTKYAVERLPATVALAIDSSTGLWKLHESESAATEKTHCKVHASGSTYFVIAGAASHISKTGKEDWSAWKIVGDALARNQDQNKIADTLFSQLSPLLKPSLKLPSTFSYWGNGKSVIEVVMVGARNGITFFHMVDISVRGDGPGRDLVLNERKCPGDCKTGTMFFSPNHLSKPLVNDPVADTKKELELALATDNKEFIPPIQQFTVSAQGQFDWKLKPDMCPMIPNY